MPAALTTFIIQIDLAKNIEDCPDLVSQISRSFVKSPFDLKDGEKRISHVIDYRGNANGLMERYKAIWGNPDVLNMRVLTASPDYATTNSITDPVCSKLDVARLRQQKRRQAKNLPNVNSVFANKKKRTRRKPVVSRRR